MKFTSLLKSVILENSKIELLLNTLTKPYLDKEGKTHKPKLSKEELEELIQADPTTSMNNVSLLSASSDDLAKIKAGSYTQWIIKHYLTPVTEKQPGERGYEQEVKTAKETYMEDLSKINNDLRKFIRFKARIQGEKDLNKLTPSELYNKVKDFSLEKVKASAEEKKEAAKTFQHPGGEVIFRGNTWTVVKITDKGQLGKDAACFYGGYYLEPSKGETRWCTSGPGLSYFDRYIKDGPLYVVIPNDDSGQKGEKSGLPADRYQFHFPSDQFMDKHDNRIDLVEYLNGPMKELKELFKPEFARGLTTSGEKFLITSFTSGPVGKFIALYGLNDLIGNLPDTLKEFVIQNSGKEKVIIEIPEEIGRFKDLDMILLENCVIEIPNSICELKKLRFLALMNNPGLIKIPECISELPMLLFLNLQGSKNVVVPESILARGTDFGDGKYDLQP